MSYDNGRPYSPYRRLILVPLWCIQLLLLPVIVIILGLLLGITPNSSSTITDNNNNNVVTIASGVQLWNIVNLAIAGALLILTCIELILFRHRDLRPSVFFIFSIIKILTWTALIGLDAYTMTGTWALEKYNRIYLVIVLGFASPIYLSFIVAFVYSTHIFVRYRKHIKALADRYIVSGPTQYTTVAH